jgi:hypothetical protein
MDTDNHTLNVSILTQDEVGLLHSFSARDLP